MTTLSGIITPTNIVTATGTTTLTNKTLTAPVLTSPNITTALTLAGAAGTNGQVLTSAGSGLPSWTTISSSPTIVRSARTANTILGTADASTLINITSGTFSQTFTAAATLGSGWFCYIQNTGTGDITLDPNGSETIDGLTSYIMYPQECRLVQCTGTAFTSVVLSPFLRTVLTTLSSFVTPPGYSYFCGYLWGAGGGGSRGAGHMPGAGGGACVPFSLTSTQMGASQVITIAAGGAGRGTDGAGSVGGNSTIGALLTSYGGGGGSATDQGTAGTGGGALSAGVNGGADLTWRQGGGPAITSGAYNSNSFVDNPGFGGGSTYSVDKSGSSFFGGGAGRTNYNGGGHSIYGGGGGGPGGTQASPSNIGTSIFGGSGGAGGNAVSGTVGTQPGGGGGSTATGTTSGAGGNGQCTIWGVA